MCQSSSWRRASRTTRMASTPAAIAAASGTRDCSGPTSGTVPGPAAGLAAAATVDFACAAVCFAAFAMLRSPLVSASFGRDLRRTRRRRRGRSLLRCRLLRRPSWRARPSWRPWPVSSSVSSQEPSWRPWPVWLAASSPGGGGRLRGRRARRRRVRELRRGSAAAVGRQAFRRVDPAGRPSGCSFAVSPHSFNPNRSPTAQRPWSRPPP